MSNQMESERRETKFFYRDASGVAVGWMEKHCRTMFILSSSFQLQTGQMGRSQKQTEMEADGTFFNVLPIWIGIEITKIRSLVAVME